MARAHQTPPLRRTGSLLRLVLALPVCAGLTMLPQTSLAAAALTLLYNERPPFMETRPDDTVAGLAITPVVRALEKAHVTATWIRTPVTRQLAMVEQNKEALCAAGKYKTPEREAFAKYSRPVYRDTVMIGLANAQLKTLAVVTLDNLLDRPGLVVLTKQSINYGPYLDAKLAAMKAQRVIVAADYDVLFQMIRIGRAQLTFMPLEEALYHTQQLALPMADFRIIKFAEMPAGEKRYLMCSKLVADELIERINAFLPTVEPQ